MIISALVGLLAAANSGDAAEAFARMRALQGSWHGTFTWTGARTDSGPMDVTYHVSGYGSVLFEELSNDGKPAMTTAYHLDGKDLRMTHFCGAGNQPRLKAQTIDLAKNIIRFEFVDATNLASPDAPHVHGFMLHLLDADHVELEFAFTAKGKESLEHIALARRAA